MALKLRRLKLALVIYYSIWVIYYSIRVVREKKLFHPLKGEKNAVQPVELQALLLNVGHTLSYEKQMHFMVLWNKWKAVGRVWKCDMGLRLQICSDS